MRWNENYVGGSFQGVWSGVKRLQGRVHGPLANASSLLSPGMNINIIKVQFKCISTIPAHITGFSLTEATGSGHHRSTSIYKIQSERCSITWTAFEQFRLRIQTHSSSGHRTGGRTGSRDPCWLWGCGAGNLVGAGGGSGRRRGSLAVGGWLGRGLGLIRALVSLGLMKHRK